MTRRRQGLVALIALLTTPATSRLLLPAAGVSLSRAALGRLRGGAVQLAGGSSAPARCTLPLAAYPAVGRTGHFDNTRKEKYWLNKEEKAQVRIPPSHRRTCVVASPPRCSEGRSGLGLGLGLADARRTGRHGEGRPQRLQPNHLTDRAA